MGNYTPITWKIGKNIIDLSSSKIGKWFDKNIQGDRLIWTIAGILSLFSILVVYSATGSLAYKRFGGNTEYFLFKQALLIVATLVVMTIIHKLDYNICFKFSKILLVVALLLLVYTHFSGLNINSATRWIQIPIVNQRFQPSDLAVVALIIRMATILSKRQKEVDNFSKTLLPLLMISSFVIILIALNNISSAILLFVVCIIMMFIGRVKVKYIAFLLLLGAVVATIAVVFGERGKTAVSRFEVFFNEREIPYQEAQAYMAIAGGGLLGKGPGQSHQKNLLPHPYSDFIFPIIIEEYGILGAFAIIIMYLTLLGRCFAIALRSPNLFGKLLTIGLSFSLIMQAFVNMAVSVGLGPITGIPLPFLSMGGTSLMFSGVSLGIILSVSKQINTNKKKRRRR